MPILTKNSIFSPGKTPDLEKSQTQSRSLSQKERKNDILIDPLTTTMTMRGLKKTERSNSVEILINQSYPASELTATHLNVSLDISVPLLLSVMTSPATYTDNDTSHGWLDVPPPCYLRHRLYKAFL